MIIRAQIGYIAWVYSKILTVRYGHRIMLIPFFPERYDRGLPSHVLRIPYTIFMCYENFICKFACWAKSRFFARRVENPGCHFENSDRSLQLSESRVFGFKPEL